MFALNPSIEYKSVWLCDPHQHLPGLTKNTILEEETELSTASHFSLVSSADFSASLTVRDSMAVAAASASSAPALESPPAKRTSISFCAFVNSPLNSCAISLEENLIANVYEKNSKLANIYKYNT